MPPQTNVYVTAPQAAKSKVFLSFFKARSEGVANWTTARSLGQSTRRTPRRPVFE
ncbi:hypothetical protein Cseg_3819 [Caulobacter segnis ATCC 21756]|uniref:Uncharacterized protein n=1 Tax=Caulobacter segnis (strain ATCC 21756 / DSM 7131 / JCM 7823 / NBRC 15250 / LMG 17158 / TK0059) TaxID=509190 RepID=D5VP16_CAUST|nr:hypothetical protein Cseg_3819 [Caulobacter segnis ATCC 21756]